MGLEIPNLLILASMWFVSIPVLPLRRASTNDPSDLLQVSKIKPRSESSKVMGDWKFGCDADWDRELCLLL